MISIALASYNGSKFIREQLDSILAQTYQDFEVVICDDCSTDNTWQILGDYASTDNRIKIFENECNLGFKKNFEKAISLCSGEYIALSDQDDIWTKNHLEVLLTNLGDKSIAGGNAILVDAEGNSIGKKLNEVDDFTFFQEDKFIYRIIFTSDPIQGGSMIMPKKFIKKCLPIPEKVKYHDAWFAACACFENGISYTFDVINNYRQHGNNITFSAHNKQQQGLIKRIYSNYKKIKKGVDTDRFIYVESIKEKYGLVNKDFVFIYNIFEKLKGKKILSLSDIKQLWKNYYFIKSKKTHKGFLKFIIALHFRRSN